MLFLSKEASNKDERLKMEMMLSMNDNKAESSTERMWKENGFFGDQRTDLTIKKANFPENTLVYVKNGCATLVKGGHAMYLDFVTLAQILANPPSDIDLENYKYQENEVLLYSPLYNTKNGLCRGLTKTLGYIILRVDVSESFFSYGYDKEQSKVLYGTNRQPLLNIFQCTAFKKHVHYLTNQSQEDLNFPKMFMFLPSTLDRKEELNQYSENVNLHPIDVSYDQLKALTNNKDFNPAHLDNSSQQNKIRKTFYSFMKEAAGTSNNNLVRNSNTFLSNGGKIDPEFEFSWVNNSYSEMQQKFQLGYQILEPEINESRSIEAILPVTAW